MLCSIRLRGLRSCSSFCKPTRKFKCFVCSEAARTSRHIACSFRAALYRLVKTQNETSDFFLYVVDLLQTKSVFFAKRFRIVSPCPKCWATRDPETLRNEDFCFGATVNRNSDASPVHLLEGMRTAYGSQLLHDFKCESCNRTGTREIRTALVSLPQVFEVIVDRNPGHVRNTGRNGRFNGGVVFPQTLDVSSLLWPAAT